MTPTPEQIAHVLELDSKRTQGDYSVEDELCSLLFKCGPSIIRHQQEQLRVAREALESCGARRGNDGGLYQIYDNVLVEKALSLIGSSHTGSDQFQLRSNEIGDKS